MDKAVKLVIADDHELIRKGLRQVTESSGYRVFEAEDGKEALDLIIREKPEIAVLDIEMPEMTGFEVANTLYRQGISVSIVFLTMYKDEVLFNKAMDIGVKGYVLKDNTVEEIQRCLKKVLKGNYYLSPEISDFLVNRNNTLMSGSSDSKGKHLLTDAERNILRQVAEMKTSQEIADSLSVSIKTVQNHRNNICKKLGLSGTHALLKYAVEHSP